MNSVMKLILHMYVVLTDLREVLIYPKNDFVTEKTSVDLPMVENPKPPNWPMLPNHLTTLVKF